MDRWVRAWLKWGKSFLPGSKVDRISGFNLQRSIDYNTKKVKHYSGRYWYTLQSMFSQKPKDSCGIPFVITRDMKKKLKELGYKERHIKKLSPEEAQLFINHDIKARKESKPETTKIDTIILGTEPTNDKSKQNKE